MYMCVCVSLFQGLEAAPVSSFLPSMILYDTISRSTFKRHSERGRVRLAMFTREQFDDAIEFIKLHCDITRNAAGVAEIQTCGLGGNQCKIRMEESLCCR